jgi:hypothetical protein
VKNECRKELRQSFHFELVLKVQPFVSAAPAKPVRLQIGIASDPSGCDRLFVFPADPKVAEVST